MEGFPRFPEIPLFRKSEPEPQDLRQNLSPDLRIWARAGRAAISIPTHVFYENHGIPENRIGYIHSKCKDFRDSQKFKFSGNPSPSLRISPGLADLDQIGTRLVPDWDQIGTRLGPDLDQIGTRLGSDLDQLGTRSGPDWDQIGTRLGPDWDQIGSRLGPDWDQIGSRLGPDLDPKGCQKWT